MKSNDGNITDAEPNCNNRVGLARVNPTEKIFQLPVTTPPVFISPMGAAHSLKRAFVGSAYVHEPQNPWINKNLSCLLFHLTGS